MGLLFTREASHFMDVIFLRIFKCHYRNFRHLYLLNRTVFYLRVISDVGRFVEISNSVEEAPDPSSLGSIGAGGGGGGAVVGRGKVSVVVSLPQSL